MPTRAEMLGTSPTTPGDRPAEASRSGDRGQGGPESRGLNALRLVEPVVGRVRDTVRVIDVEQVRAALESHRALLVEVDAGRVEASGVQRAYLAGSADVLARLVDGDLDVIPSTGPPRATPAVPQRGPC